MLNYLFTSYAYAIPPILGFLVFFSLSLIALFKGKRNSTSFLFAGLCFFGAIINGDVALISLISDKILALKVDRFTYFFFVFSLPVCTQFVHSFLGIRRRGWLEYIAYLFSLIFLFFTPSSLFISGLNTYRFGTVARPGPIYIVFAVVTCVVVSYSIFMLFIALRRAQGNELKNRIKYILGGIGFSIILLILNLLPISGIDMYPPGNFSFIPAIFLAFGVLKYDLLDIGAVVRQGMTYFILTAVLTIFYVVLLYLFNTFLVGMGGSNVMISFMLALFMVLLFNPITQWVKRGIDKLFFRGHYDYQEVLKNLSGNMASLLSLHQIRDLLLTSISSVLQLSRVCLFLYDDGNRSFTLYDNDEGKNCGQDIEFLPTHPLVEYLEKTATPLGRLTAERLKEGKREKILQFFNDFQAIMIVPMFSSERLVGLIALGEKKSGELFVHEDMELLTTIANQAVTAIENVHAYAEIEKLNADLERKVTQRTASLRKTLEEKERTQKQLVQSESLAAIGQLVAGAAHELNNPLASASSLIQSSLETIAEWKLREPEVVDDLKFSLKELKRMGDIVKSLLDLSRKTQVYVEPVLINLAIDDALRVLYNQYKYLRVEIEKNYDENLPVVEGNFANIGQVFVNIIKNALQSLPNGNGRITIATRYREEEDRVVIECKDNGTGIPRQHQKDIFKPFFTTKGVGEGTGLGLYICHEIIKLHDGSIEVNSESGRGTSVVIELPCHRGRGHD